jgi:hypothetical protein
MDFQGHAGLTGTMLKSISQSMLDDWLGEMEEIGLIEAVPEGEESVADFASALDRTLKLTELDRNRLNEDTQAASEALANSGAYIATHRLRERPAAGKAPADTTVLIVEDDQHGRLPRARRELGERLPADDAR